MSQGKVKSMYEKFQNEADEKNGNFYFVSRFDEELYGHLCQAERNAVLNLKAGGTELRAALEVFMKKAAGSDGQKELSPGAKTVDYENYFKDHPELAVDAGLFRQIRIIENVFHHTGNKKNSSARTYDSLCKGLEYMYILLHKYYRQQNPDYMKKFSSRSYNPDIQPYGDKLVCSVIETSDSTACEKQVLCCSRSGRNADKRHYYLLRIYREADTSEGAIRDEKVLESLWGGSLKDYPNIVRYNPIHVEYNGDAKEREKKYIIAYDFGYFKPCPLNPEMIRNLTLEQKLTIMHDAAAGVQVLHREGIFHRNIQPDSIFVFFDKKSDNVQAKLVGFEYAKIKGDSATVIKSVTQHYQNRPTSFYSTTMRQALNNYSKVQNLDWSKEDIYSLGAIFYFILEETPPMPNIRNYTFRNKQVSENLKALIKSMLSPNVRSRPGIEQVMEELDNPN